MIPLTPIDEPIRVMIVDDDREVREAISWIIENSEGFECVGRFESSAEALRGTEEEAPDVVLMDIGLGEESGIDVVRLLKHDYPRLQILMLTVFSDDEKIFESLRAGAVGYLLKKTSAPRLLEAIREAHSGGAPMSGEVARKVLGYFRETAFDRKTSGLSEREHQVLEALIEGHSYKTIADKLFLSVHTVRFHLHNIYEKLHVSSRAEAVAKATRTGVGGGSRR